MSDGLGITARWPRLLCPAGQAFPLKVIRFAEPRHGSSFWHELRDVQAALAPTGGYKRGGNLSCRWVLDTWGKWTKQCIEFGSIDSPILIDVRHNELHKLRLT